MGLSPSPQPNQLADLLSWARHFLPRHFTCNPSGLHTWFRDQVDAWLPAAADRHGVRLNVIGPRGSAKSTLASLAYVLRCALEGREPYIWLVGDTWAQARIYLDNLKKELAENQAILAAYPCAGSGPVWRSAAIQLPNGVYIEALSTGQRLRGRRHGQHRPTLIVCDDLQNDFHIASALQRERSVSWFQGAVLPAGTSATNVIHVATTLHRDALALQLAANPGWISRTFRAIEQWPQNLSLWHEWEALYCRTGVSPVASSSVSGVSPVTLDENQTGGTPVLRNARSFYDAHRAQMDLGAALLWPDREDLYTLMCMRAELGRTAFEREKQSSPINPAECEWPESYFTEAIWFDEWPTLVMRAVALDPSKGTDARRGDFSAIVRLGVTKDNVFYVDADLARRPTPQMIADFVAHALAFRAQWIGLETNQYQELLAGEVQAEIRRQKAVDLGIFGLDNQVNKLVRIRRLGPLLATKRLRFKNGSAGAALLVRQLQDFPQAGHDDGPDALEMAVRLVCEMPDEA